MGIDACGGRRDKTVELRLRDGRLLINAFGLDCTERSVAEFGDEVDAGVGTWTVGPFIPQPDLFDGVLSERIDRGVFKPPLGNAFELFASGVGVGGQGGEQVAQSLGRDVAHRPILAGRCVPAGWGWLRHGTCGWSLADEDRLGGGNSVPKQNKSPSLRIFKKPATCYR